MGNVADILLYQKQFPQNLDATWLFSTFAWQRNLDKHLFPAKMEPKDLKQLQQLLHLQVKNALDFENFFCLSEISGLEKELVSEHFFLEQPLQNFSRETSFAIDKTSNLLCVVNHADHLHFQQLVTGAAPAQVFADFSSKIQKLATNLAFAFDPYFGYLTANPEKAGSGFTFQAFLHLPLLIATGQLDDILLMQADEKIKTSSLDGKPDHLADLLLVGNHSHLGVSPETSIHDVETVALKLSSLEKQLQQEMKAKDDLGIRDQIHRAYGLLLHASQLPTQEALDLLSKIKLGIEMNLIEQVTPSLVHQIMSHCRRAHFMLGQKCPSEDKDQISIQRAAWIKQLLQKMSIKDHF